MDPFRLVLFFVSPRRKVGTNHVFFGYEDGTVPVQDFYWEPRTS